MATRTFDYCILGAGLAGLSLADSLQERKMRVCVLENNSIASGASGAPLGMINPATGRRATKTWRAEKCYEAIAANLEKTSPFAERIFYKRNGVLRPALTAKIADKMRSQLEKTRWPEGWCRWLSEAELLERHPGINCVEGGLWIPVGITVDLSGYLQALGRYLETHGVAIHSGSSCDLEQNGEMWEITTPDQSITARRLVFATGYAALQHPWWKDLDLHPIKGQLAIFEPDEPLPFSHSVSSLGYIARLDNNRFVQGSTYEHDFESLEPDRFGEEYLRNKLRRTLPRLEQTSRLVDQWAGVRVSTPNRKPVLGRHQTVPNAFIYNGLGSKGLLYGKYLADHFADHLERGTPLLSSVDVGRLY